MKLFTAFACLLAAATFARAETITIVHTNDIHSHYQPENANGVSCSPTEVANNQCFGGSARLKAAIDAIRANRTNVVLLDAGDQFQGTLFYTYLKAYPASVLMNTFKYDAMTLGNHEFDETELYLSQFIKNLTFPVLAANIEPSSAPNIFNAGVKPYTIIAKHNLAIIGVITRDTKNIASGAADVVFLDPIPIVQKYVDEVRAQGIKKVVVLSHLGYDVDKDLAAQTSGVDVILGGHSHSYLINEKASVLPGQLPSGYAPEGFYPTKITNKAGKNSLVLTAYRYGVVLGAIDLSYGDDGELQSVTPIGGNAPFWLDASFASDAAVNATISEWEKTFASELTKKIGSLSNPPLDDPRAICRARECNIGNLITDAMLDRRWFSGARIAFTNSGGIRATLTKYDITYGDVLTILPFGNVISEIQMTGNDIIELLERVAARTFRDGTSAVITIPQWAGLKFTANLARPAYARVDRHNISVFDDNRKYVPLELTKTYRVVTNDFVARGGDSIIPKQSFLTFEVMADGVAAFIIEKGTVAPVVEGRFELYNNTASANTTTTSATTTFSATTIIGASTVTSAAASTTSPCTTTAESTPVSTPTSTPCTTTPNVSGEVSVSTQASTPVSTPCTTTTLGTVEGGNSTPLPSDGYATTPTGTVAGETPCETSTPGGVEGEQSTPGSGYPTNEGYPAGEYTTSTPAVEGENTTSTPCDGHNGTPTVGGEEGTSTPAGGYDSTPVPSGGSESAYLSAAGDSSSTTAIYIGAGIGGAAVVAAGVIASVYAIRRRKVADSRV
ncbi:Metallo-dependent phosphatase-like protein [Cladochytrium replicatum]|nr:Metallo-dependent phosphatase-like protein [Cladochytrium replicatum]